MTKKEYYQSIHDYLAKKYGVDPKMIYEIRRRAIVLDRTAVEKRFAFKVGRCAQRIMENNRFIDLIKGKMITEPHRMTTWHKRSSNLKLHNQMTLNKLNFWTQLGSKVAELTTAQYTDIVDLRYKYEEQPTV